ncbi:MAG: archaeosortase/exosortase family protein, partial [Microcystaceae cyanobacterium]
ANLMGVCLILVPYLTANFAEREISIYWYFFPLISGGGLALLASGFRGIKQFQRELTLCALLPIILLGVKLIQLLLRSLPIPLIYAKSSSFLLWYLGFDSATKGTFVYVNGGVVDIAWSCTGINFLLLLFQFSILLLIFSPGLLKNKYFPFIVAVIISYLSSIIRLMIMALVVKDKTTFDYWHGVQGGNLFALLSMVSFGMVIIFAAPNEPINESITTEKIPSSTISRPLSKMAIAVGVCLLLLLLNFALQPTAGLSTIASYSFPQEITLPGWQLVTSETSSLPLKSSDKEYKEPAPITTEIEEAPKSNQIKVERQTYRYQKSELELTADFHYLHSTTGEIKSYYENFQHFSHLPKLEEPIKKTGDRGSYYLFTDSQYQYLTACINPLGESVVSQAEFNDSFYRAYRNPSQWWNFLRSSFRDQRCIWGQLTLPLTTKKTELNTLWPEFVRYWQEHFPPLKS